MGYIQGDLLVAKKENGTCGNVTIEGSLTVSEINGLREIYEIIGDGTQTNFFVSHTLGIKDVATSVYNEDGIQCLVSVSTTSIGNLVISFAQPPQMGDRFLVVIQK